MISRRRLVTLFGSAILGVPRSGEAQQAGRVYRIGFLGIGSANANTPEGIRLWAAFRQGLSELGWVEGRNLSIERRYAEGIRSRYPQLAAELVRLKVDIITTATGWDGVLAAKQATTTIPIVMLSIGDPVAAGFVSSLARPGGNITGIADLSGALIAKRLQLLKEAVPRVSRVVNLVCPIVQEIPANTALRNDWVAAAKVLDIRLRHVDVKDLQDFEPASAAVLRERPEALLLGPCPIIFHLRRQIAEFALIHRLPTVSVHRETANAGALMAYGSDPTNNFRRGAVVNLKTAKALGLTIPPSLLASVRPR